MFFEQLIGLLNTRPMVPGKTAECLRLWETFTERQQQQIYSTIYNKLRAGKFVHYDPVVTLMPGIQSISGRVGDFVFRTRKSTGEVTMIYSPKPKKKEKIEHCCVGNA